MGTHTEFLGMDLAEGDGQEWMHDWWRTVGGETWNPFPGGCHPKSHTVLQVLGSFSLWDKRQSALLYLWSHLLFCHGDEPSGPCAGHSWIWGETASDHEIPLPQKTVKLSQNKLSSNVKKSPNFSMKWFGMNNSVSYRQRGIFPSINQFMFSRGLA